MEPRNPVLRWILIGILFLTIANYASDHFAEKPSTQERKCRVYRHDSNGTNRNGNLTTKLEADRIMSESNDPNSSNYGKYSSRCE